jgi:hypothetical protein
VVFDDPKVAKAAKTWQGILAPRRATVSLSTPCFSDIYSFFGLFCYFPTTAAR